MSLIMESHRGRLERLIPIRVGRMVASPYGFLRGTAIVMADDMARLPRTGITPVICGDAHLGNFGFYASPERDLVIDLNDFDEAHPGCWEWDLRRLVASIWVAGRQNGFAEALCRSSVASCVAAYRAEIAYLAEQPLLARSYQRLDVRRLHATTPHGSLRAEIARAAAQARGRTSDRALPRFTTQEGGRRRIAQSGDGRSPGGFAVFRPPGGESAATRGHWSVRVPGRAQTPCDHPPWLAAGGDRAGRRPGARTDQ